MTNEEKAKEIAEETLGDFSTSFLGWIDECSEMFCTESAARMAEWKDQQYADIIKEECNTSYESGLAEGERKAEARFKEYLEKKKTETLFEKISAMPIVLEKANLIDEIIDELFKENRL